MKIETIVVPLAALAIGGALGYAIPRPAPEAPAAAAPVARQERRAPRPAPEADGAREALRRENAELKRRLAESRQNESEATERAQAAQLPKDGDVSGWIDFARRQFPHQFSAATNEFARHGRRVREQGRATMAFFDAIDLTNLAEGDREVIERHKELLARRDALMAQTEGMSPEDMMRMGPQMGELMGELMRSNADVRETMIKSTLEDLGYKGEDVGAISGRLNEIIQVTGGGGRGFGWPGGPGGGRGGRGFGGRGGNGGRR